MIFDRLPLGKCCLIVLLSLLVGFAEKSMAQKQEQNSTIQPLSKEARIWTGTASLRWYNFYTPTVNGLEKKSNTELNFETRHIWLTSSNFGLGLKGMTQLFMTGFFGNIGVGNVGIGPLVRAYPWQNKHWQFYVQGGMLAGYDLALSDALGANRSEGIKYRLGLRSGLSYRVSNAFGIYIELGPDWETGRDFGFGARALQFDIGIQLYRF